MKRESSVDILEKIETMRNERGWSVNRFAKECGIPVSTLNNLYLRASVPSIGTLEMICDSLGVDLCDFFQREEALANGNLALEKELLIAFRTLPEREQRAVLNLIHSLRA